jgi:peptide/nickel transport system permease protein
MVGERASPEAIEKIRKEIGADKGIIRQYAGYLLLLSRGEMGRSYHTNRKVFDDLREKFPNTFMLAAAAMGIAAPLGILLGLIAALNRGRAPDRLITWISVSGISLPVFWIGLVLMLFFSLKLRLLPPSGTGGLQYLVLPAVTLSMPAIATLVRVTRVAVLEIRDMPYIRTATAKGLGRVKITSLHILRNALIPVVTVIGLEIGSYLNGAVLTETIFGWDGIGRYTMEAITKRDFPVIMGCILAGTIVFVLINLIVDIVYHSLDPRVRMHGQDS